MIALLQFLFDGHVHYWETLDRGYTVDDQNRRNGAWFVQRCTKCGRERYYQS